jgi:lysophospholipase L1-like esterase
MKWLWTVLAAALAAPIAGADDRASPSGNVPVNPCCVPAPRDGWWPAYHAGMLKREKRADAQVVFLGDSITMMWRSQSGYEGGTPVWQKHYAPLKAANLGISGDCTQNVLWRITAGGDLDGLRPKVLVLLIGINNFHLGKNTPQETAAGIGRIVEVVQEKLPHTQILLLGLFPAGQQPTHPWRAWARQVNAIIAQRADWRRVFYLDIGPRFVEPDGTISKTKLRDYLHLSEKGYWIWAEAMKPYLDDLLENQGRGAVWRQAASQPPK